MGHRYNPRDHQQAYRRRASGNFENTWVVRELPDWNGTVSSRTGKGYSNVTDLNLVEGRRRPALAGKQELKYFDVDSAGSFGPSILYTNTLNPIPRGVSQSTRIGRKIAIWSIEMRWTAIVLSSPTSPKTAQDIRLLIVVDNQTNGGTVDILDLLDTQSPLSFRNLDHATRFTIILDRRVSVNTIAGGGANTFESNFSGKIMKRFAKAIVCEFEDPGTGVLATITTRNIFFMAVTGDENPGNALLDVKFRIRYTDGN